jgi:hypothetical protein
MLDIDISYNQTETMADYTANYHELNRILSAAIVSTGFRNMLITHPEMAITKGYQGEKFNLSSDEYQWLVSVQATDLSSFASQLLNFQTSHTPSSNLAIAVKLPAMSRVGNHGMTGNDWSLG